MGYTTFAVEPKDFAADAKTVTVTAVVKNTGTTAGKEVVQVYYSAPDGVLDRPYQELAGFAKTRELQPGEQEEVTVSFTTESMAGYDMRGLPIYWKPEFIMYASETVREIRISRCNHPGCRGGRGAGAEYLR